MEIKINNLTDEQLKEVSALVKKFEEDNEKPKKVIDYNNGFVINGTGVSRGNVHTRDGVDMFYSLGLYRDTRQECEKPIKKMKIEHRLREWAKMCNDKVDWSSKRQDKYYIYKYGDSVLTDTYNQVRCNDIYFTDKSILQKAIEDIGEQKLIDEYFVEV